ncbi:hypothetical protein [Halomarina oriensis]|uniref:DUF1102 domain-containing protein n=1 Tax=Halomarina oriensis TaxID=671145 RepID=A0A6B0GKE2_9EURY|nr:hypothetical protein [Halomarina oriensis]MWG34351.1 hypothetical protein [Halomarina oriensis]
MQRRKFLLGAGSLAAGAAAAMGTGAFTHTAARRGASFKIATDENAFLQLTAPNTLENGEYADDSTESVLPGDQLTLTFDENAEVTGTGLNADAQQWFDEVFQIANHGTKSVNVFVDDDELTHSDRIVFYTGDTDGEPVLENPDEGFSLSGYSPSAEGPFSADDDETAVNNDPGSYWVTLGPGDAVAIGVYVDTRDLETVQDLTPTDEEVVIKAEG